MNDFLILGLDKCSEEAEKRLEDLNTKYGRLTLLGGFFLHVMLG
jgi:hypothetical protein